MYAIANTFGLPCRASAFADISTPSALKQIAAARERNTRVLPVGAGSNILFADPTIDAMVLQCSDKRISYQPHESDSNSVLVEAGAGVVWHQLVLDSLARNLSGLENLSLIPGTVGAAPIQNIGAYGVEICELITQVNAIDLETGDYKTFSREACQFSYRDSIFKRVYKDRLLITSVQFCLSRQAPIKASYESLAQYLQRKDLAALTARDISDAVIAVRRARLPDPEQLGNAGSFFKNPLVDAAAFTQLIERFPTMPHYPQINGQFKLAAGWLIEQCGLKGAKRGSVGVHEKQALVLVNLGGTDGRALVALAREVKRAVQDRFEINIEHEVRILDRDACDIELT